jgi:hypothetical protein
VYLDHVKDPTPLQRQQAQQMSKSQSGCGLVAEAVARDVGADWPHAYKFYGEPSRISGVIRDMVKEAKKQRAWVDATKRTASDPLPQPGDLVLIGGGSGWAQGGLTMEHMLIVDRLEGHELHSVDGGQPDVEERTRVVVLAPGGELWLGSREAQIDAAGRPTVGRRVRGWVDVSKVPVVEGKGTNRGSTTTAPFPGGGASSGGGSSASWECPPCPELPEGITVGWRTGIGLMLLAYLAGELTGQWVEAGRKSSRRTRR